jgi:hypothetical protein
MANVDVSSALGADIDIRTGDFSFGLTGDVNLLAQLDLVGQRCYLSALPDPGTVIMQPTMGAGVASQVERPYTQAAADQISGQITNQLLQDPAISSVQEVDVFSPGQGQVAIIPIVVPVGGAAVPLPLPLVTGFRTKPS